MYFALTAAASAQMTSVYAAARHAAALRQIEDPNAIIDQLPQEVLDNLPPDVLQGLRDGTLKEIPNEAVDRLKERVSAGVLDRVPDNLLEDSTNQAMLAVLIVVGLIAGAGFLWGVMKSAMKAAFFFGVVAAGAGYLLYTNG